jgi:2-polyprenyl-6-hydroxyphenyl methylase/3-demethylubiquinone-9 3-methyltransferase
MSAPPATLLSPGLPPRVTPARSERCKVCDADSPRFAAVDFNKICSHTPWADRDPIGVPVLYHRCARCKLIFTTYFDAFGPDDFRRHVYNEEYYDIDGEYHELRPKNTASLIANSFRKRDLRVLDYGGGNGATATFLRAAGFPDVTVYEPFNPDFSLRPGGKFDLILCVEVMEHFVSPLQLASDLASFLAPEGLIYLTTLLQPQTIDTVKGEHWYLAPRNGHISFHSPLSLPLCFATQKLRFGKINNDRHVFFKTIPDWAAHLFKKA